MNYILWWIKYIWLPSLCLPSLPYPLLIFLSLQLFFFFIIPQPLTQNNFHHFAPQHNSNGLYVDPMGPDFLLHST